MGNGRTRCDVGFMVGGMCGADFIVVPEIFSRNDAADMDASDSTQNVLTSGADRDVQRYHIFFHTAFPASLFLRVPGFRKFKIVTIREKPWGEETVLSHGNCH